jgi:hypothetical protein
LAVPVVAEQNEPIAICLHPELVQQLAKYFVLRYRVDSAMERAIPSEYFASGLVGRLDI